MPKEKYFKCPRGDESGKRMNPEKECSIDLCGGYNTCLINYYNWQNKHKRTQRKGKLGLIRKL